MTERPITLTITAAVEAAEGAVALLFGLFVCWETIVGKSHDPVGALGLAALTLLGAAGMLAVARGLLRMQRWSRSPAVLTQLFALPVSVSMIQSGQYAFGAPLIAFAIVALVLLLGGPAARVLAEEHEPPER